MKNILLPSCLLLLGAALGAADYKPDENGYLRNWLMLDAFAVGDSASEHGEDAQKKFFTNEAFAGHFTAKPKSDDKVTISMAGVDAATVTWKEMTADGAVLSLPEQENSLFLGVVYVTSPRAYEGAMLSIGSDDSSSWRVDGKEVVTVYEGRAAEADQNRSSPFTLKQGTTVISATVINGGGQVGLSARVLDSAGSAIADLTVSLTPPATP